MALAHNPTLAQAAAQVEAARGRAVQAGLSPNPTVGYEGDELGNNGTAGQQGVFIDQLIVTGGKLRLNRARFRLEATQMEWQAAAQQYRVLNAVRMHFWKLLALQRLITVRESLLKIADDAVVTTRELINVGQANRPDLLQAEVEANRLKVLLQNARVRYEADWRQFAALVGQPCLPPAPLQGDLEAPGALPEFDAAFAHLIEASPEVQFALAGVQKGELSLRREQVEPVPNVRVRLGTQYNFDTKYTQGVAQLGVTLPVWDRNQGNILAAQANLARAQLEVGRVELALRQRLARAYASFQTARNVAENYRTEVVPKAKEAYELYLESFRRQRAAYPQVIIAQRNYVEAADTYVEALAQLRRAEVAVLGLLLVDGLDEPPGPPSEGFRFDRREQNQGDGQFRRNPIGDEGRRLDDRIGGRPSE
jgi:cobalt-zinc-cadmium efflux system outer membrane protein